MPTDLLPPRDTQYRFVRFGVVGLTAYAVTWLMMKLLTPWLPPNLAFGISYVCSVITHYSLNRFWALPSTRQDSWRQLGEYIATAILSGLIQFALFRICIDAFGLGNLWATAIAVPPSTVLVFLMLHLRVFKARRA